MLYQDSVYSTTFVTCTTLYIPLDYDYDLGRLSSILPVTKMEAVGPLELTLLGLTRFDPHNLHIMK
jgi:hypothetical protein